MKVFALPADDSACGAYRIRYPAAAVAAILGVEVEVAAPQWPQHKSTGEVPVHLNLEGADVLVCHRPSFPALVDELERQQHAGVALVVDIDDDLEHGHPGHVWSRGERGQLARESQMRASRLADMVTVSTPALAEVYGAHGRCEVLRNCIPASMLALPRESDGKTLGWGGLASGHPDDLEVTGGAVADALEGSDWTFKVIGPAEDVRTRLGMTSAPCATGGLSLADYQQALGSLDVGIVPLADTPFNRAKSGLKGLEYAARGVPFGASPTPEYLRLAEEGIGRIAKTPAGWRGHLRDLLGDESLRLEMGAAGRARVAERHTYEARAEEWAEAWVFAQATRLLAKHPPNR